MLMLRAHQQGTDTRGVKLQRFILTCLILLVACQSAAAGGRVALVIGNSNYLHTSQLTNPVNDATDMSDVFRRLGFQVIKGLNLKKAEMDLKLRDFAAAIRGAEIAVFFYAGHGLQVDGKNYLVPIDAKAETKSALDFEMLRLSLVQRTMENEAKASVIFLDACRNNPLTRNLARALGHRSTSIGYGLAEVKAGFGTLISFATQPGNVALDGTGRNSPYTAALKRHILRPQLDLPSTLINVRVEVVEETEHKQVPWEQSALMGQLYLSGMPQASNGSAVADVRSSSDANSSFGEASRVWRDIKDSRNDLVLDAFAKRYAGTVYADMAKAAARAVRAKRTAAFDRNPLERKPQTANSHRRSPETYAADCADAAGVKYCVSSFLPTSGVNRSKYGPDSMLDGNDQTAWVEGRTDKSDKGIGEWVVLSWGAERRLAGVRIKNGYAKTERHYQMNGRVSRLLFSFSNGNRSEYQIEDTSSWQTIKFAQPEPAKWVKIEVRAAKRGRKYADTAINEIKPVFE